MSEDKNARFDAAVTAMTQPENRFDVVIICTTDDYQAEFWMSKLSMEKAEGEQFPVVLAVSEDWGGSGAGNGLGTLYAWKKACDYAMTKHQMDLPALLADSKVSAALYHTAGKGTRMAPLPASENNNKPGVVSVWMSVTFWCKNKVSALDANARVEDSYVSLYSYITSLSLSYYHVRISLLF